MISFFWSQFVPGHYCRNVYPQQHISLVCCRILAAASLDTDLRRCICIKATLLTFFKWWNEKHYEDGTPYVTLKSEADNESSQPQDRKADERARNALSEKPEQFFWLQLKIRKHKNNMWCVYGPPHLCPEAERLVSSMREGSLSQWAVHSTLNCRTVATTNVNSLLIRIWGVGGRVDALSPC